MLLEIIKSVGLLVMCLAASSFASPLRKTRDTAATSAPTSPILRWHQPCSGSSPVSNGPALGPVISAPPLGESAFTIRMHITENKNKIEDLRSRWVRERFYSNPEYINWIESQYIVPSSLPQEEHWLQFIGIQNAVNNVDEFLSQSYSWLATIAVHLEEIRIDELSSNTVHNQENEDAQKIQIAEDQLYICMCSVHTLMTSRGLELDQSITRGILGTEFSDPPNKTFRYQRDWIVVNHFRKLLAHLEKVYIELQEL